MRSRFRSPWRKYPYLQDQGLEEKSLKLFYDMHIDLGASMEKMSPVAAATLVLQARYHALASVNALEFHERFQSIVGLDYRHAAVTGA
jgi:hypothetical protein